MCLSVTVVNLAKTAELIEMLLGLRTQVGPGNNVVVDGSRYLMGTGNFEAGMGGPLQSIWPLCRELRKKWLN